MGETVIENKITNEEPEVNVEEEPEVNGEVMEEEPEVAATGKTIEDEYREELDFMDEQITSNAKEKRRLMVVCGVIIVLCVICLTARILAWG